MMKHFSRLFFYLLLLFSLLTAKDFKKIHEKAIVVDTHNDVLLRAMEGEDLSIRTANGHSDVVRLKEGGVDVQIFSVWCGGNFGKGRAFKRAIEMIDTLEAIISRSGGKMLLVKTPKELEKALKQNKIAALIGVEGGHMIEDSLEYLDQLAKRGMRYMTLTWNNSTSWATSAADETKKGDSLESKGLTEFGKKVIRHMNTLGVMVDLSHVGERTFWDAINTTAKPVIVSHSSVYNICPGSRNLKDDQIKAVAKNKGVVCVNFYSGFIDSTYSERVQAVRKENKAIVDSIRNSHQEHYRMEAMIDSALAPKYNEVRPPLSLLIDHIDYIAKLVGVDYVGLGSDFDGIESLPQEMDDVTFLPNITRELLKRGYAEKEVRKILGENVIRVFKANEQR
ncbi:MAG: dipeptidase [Bacteroidota bacterium]